ncbi:MAG: hypothetical protein GW805_07495 [Ignavibacteria bacterium]|nr:hypothetical protein [Ignavibacteria bacterium]OIO18057.1 MAG: hypothetical protein AUJ54_08895 [Ignavibacteria bacterium CG1_02_37_35]PIS44704.1 MAG: hypothetical protein COT22_09120 [Ignavibacteria bacterium CG08_land_8_20_14_0_20_37_9]
MKNIFCIASILFIFIGCSSTYKVTNFPSKEKFYEEFNDTFKEKEARVTLVNDSSFMASDGTIIKDSSLVLYIKLVEKNNNGFALSSIADLSYDRDDYQKASILLKNNCRITAENVKIVKDSIYFVELKNIITTTTIPISEVKTTSYTNKWKGLVWGSINGLLSGGIIGYLLGKTAMPKPSKVQGGGHDESEDVSGLLLGSVAGFVSGGCAGYILGYPITYEFDK